MQSDGIKSDEATFLIVVGMVDEIPFSRYRERGTTVLRRTDTEVRFLSVNFSHSLKACITCETDVCNGIGVNRILRDGIVQFNGSCSPDTHITDTQRPPPYCLTAAETKKARDQASFSKVPLKLRARSPQPICQNGEAI